METKETVAKRREEVKKKKKEGKKWDEGIRDEATC